MTTRAATSDSASKKVSLRPMFVGSAAAAVAVGFLVGAVHLGTALTFVVLLAAVTVITLTAGACLVTLELHGRLPFRRLLAMILLPFSTLGFQRQERRERRERRRLNADERWWLERRRLEAAEMRGPHAHARANVVVGDTVVAHVMAKAKGLLDSGAITNDEFERIEIIVRRQVEADFHKRAFAAHLESVAAAADPAAQIASAKELLDSGAITNDEFERISQRLQRT